MAADDLMIEILDPLTPGDYTVEWTTLVADNPTIYSGKFDLHYKSDPDSYSRFSLDVSPGATADKRIFCSVT